ncbi:Xaa-Pro dipeptidyl-peptidase [Furfurilactobacillus siliginis]|uniref:Xaa-Pro dipeptidyl-peptidase n=1 Tax=Furfurilactobacillus siliginis TaxID=348151 RepID=A0A0R2L988_9LACO|nr:Xaa-Pro dipeptidyl-peptidase [Furfurilactobacillus siliginis]KRN96373.1 xaa-pro dipeptidyl-peptidase [Furfurilactobacillus siliginis]GEK28996.1 Xaa-Pro dipeptidyl-peptidase [Furfurilactobacillus siliginis]
MKNNQFARQEVPLQTAITELQRIHFYDETIDHASNGVFAYRLLLRKAFLDAKTGSSFDGKLTNYLATTSLNLAAWLDTEQPVTAAIFYRVALQLTGFLADVDYDLADPLAAMAKIQLPVHHSADTAWTKDDVLAAWYLLLTTHTKNGQTYLDQLATQGYFANFYDLPIADKPLFFNGKAQPVFDQNTLLREVVYVESDVDSDHDGHRDLLKAEIIRPLDSNAGLKVPALYTASPYNQGINDEAGDAQTHNVNVPLTEKQPTDTSYETIAYQDEAIALPAARTITNTTTIAEETFGREQSYTLNDYFLARGFAAVYAAGIGTVDSDGVQTCGSVEQTKATTAIIEWLNGDRVAFTNRTDNVAITAWWCNGSIAMTGRSYLGTLATAAATTGVAGLKTIISEAAISSWYDYYRDNGLVVAPDGFPGEDADVLAVETFSRMMKPADYHTIKPFFDEQMTLMQSAMDRTTGNYNTFWDERNYRKNIKNIKADIVMIHGLNDWNVKPRNVERLWAGLRDLPVAKKIILHQGQHIYINAFRSLDYTDMMNLWLSHELYGLDNGAKELLPNVLVQDNVTPETWNAYEDWSEPTLTKQRFHFADDALSNVAVNHGAKSFSDQLPQTDFDRYVKNTSIWENDLLTTTKTPLTGNRLLMRSAQLTDDQTIDGKPVVHVSVAVNQPLGMLSFQLVDYGDAKRFNVTPTTIAAHGLDLGFHWREDALREFTLASKTTPFKMITKGHINLQNREHPWKNDPVKPNQFYDVTVELQPTFHHLLAGHQLGLVVYATDFGMTVRGNQDLQYSIALDDSFVDVPFR